MALRISAGDMSLSGGVIASSMIIWRIVVFAVCLVFQSNLLIFLFLVVMVELLKKTINRKRQGEVTSTPMRKKRQATYYR